LEDGEKEEEANEEEYGKKASKKRARRNSDPARDLECAKKVGRTVKLSAKVV
jgi:hypothetical protein